MVSVDCLLFIVYCCCLLLLLFVVVCCCLLLGSVLYMTSPDSPSMVVNKLNKINEVGGALLSGYYTQSNDSVRKRPRDSY